jgi:hypothetical protein
VQVTGGLTGVVAIAAGTYHTVAMKGDGTVWAGGANNSGQLGDMTLSKRLTPVQMFIFDNTPPIARMLRTYCLPNASVTNAPVYYDPDLNGPWTAVVVSNAAHGTVAGGANLVYTPNADFQGVDSFQYLVNDGETNSNVATGYVNVRAYGKPAGMLVDIVVNDSLYTVLSNEVQRLKTDLTNEGYTAIITPVSSGTSAGEVWTNLNSIYQTTNWLVGALFIGNIAKMAPDGIYSDGYYWNMQTFQTSAGKVGSHDIWVGRFTIDASGDSNLYGTEVDLIRYALDANHYYRTGQSRLPNTAYVHVGIDWGGDAQAATEVNRAKQVWTNAFVDSNADGTLNGANGSDLICELSHGSAGDYSAGMSKAGAHAGLVQSRAMFCTSCESGSPNGVVNHQLFSRGGGNLFSVGATTACNPFNYTIFRDYDWPWPPWAAFRALLGAGETWGHAMLQRYPLVDSDGSSVASDTMIYGDLSMRPLATPPNAMPRVDAFTNNCTTVYVGQPVTFSVAVSDPDGTTGEKSPHVLYRQQVEWFMNGYNYGKNAPTYTTNDSQNAGWTNVTHTFSAAGTNTVRVEVMDEWRARGWKEMTVTVQPLLVTVAAPTALTATAVNTHQIQLAWTDNATNETGYALDRSPDGSTWNALTSLVANATAYTDDGLAAGTRYYYRVAATNSDGLSAYASANATTVSNSAILTSASSVNVPEGGTITFQLWLSSQPTRDVTVAVAWAAGDTSITVMGGSSLTFTTNNWATHQTVTLAAAEDADAVNDSATITCSGAGLTSGSVTATETDNDTTLTVTAGTGGSTTPSGATVVTQGAARDISATAGAGYAFANWSVTSGAATFANSNAASTTVTISAPATVQANFSRVAILTSAPFVGVPEGGTAKFRVSLSAQPAGSVTVSVAHGGDSQLSVQSGGSLIFSTSDWSLWKTVTLADAEDGVTNRHVATFTCSSAGMEPVIVTATGIDNDRPVPVDSDGDGLPDALEARLGRVTNAFEVLTALPFAERFESDTVSLGLLHGQHNWVVNPADAATVQTSEVFEGTRALRIEGTNDSSGTVSQAFTSTPQTVWLDLRITVAGAAVPGSLPDAASVFFFNDAGQLVVCDGARPAGSEWVTLTNTAPRQVGTWARLTASADYVLQTWSLYLDGTNVAANLGFAVPQKRLTCLSMEGPTAVVDNLTVGYGRPDGIPGSSNVAPDDWYLDHFGTLAYSDTDDPDHDGMSNLAEYIAGTDPTDSTSLLKLTEAVTPRANPGEFIIRWQSVTGRVYTLQATTNLMNGFTALTNGLPATPTVNVYTDKVNGAEQKFYRVGVE